jgi:hypothetical protein
VSATSGSTQQITTCADADPLRVDVAHLHRILQLTLRRLLRPEDDPRRSSTRECPWLRPDPAVGVRERAIC